MKRHLSEWLFLVLFWASITVVYAITLQSYFEFWLDLTNTAGLVNNDPLIGYLLSNLQYVESVMFGIFFGSLFFGINRIIDKTGLFKMTFVKVILIKSAFYLIALVIVYYFMERILIGFNIAPASIKEEFVENGVNTRLIISTFLFFSLTILLTNFILQVNKNIGEKI